MGSNPTPSEVIMDEREGAAVLLATKLGEVRPKSFVDKSAALFGGKTVRPARVSRVRISASPLFTRAESALKQQHFY